MQKGANLTIVSTTPLICLNTPCPLNPLFSNQLLYNKISSSLSNTEILCEEHVQL